MGSLKPSVDNFEKGPNFFVIGVVKGGTTSLYHYLAQHPQVYLPPVKETNHFAAADIREEDFLPEYATDVRIDLDAYIKRGMPEQVHIAHVNRADHYAALFSRVNGEKAVGEISNSYMVCPSAAAAIHTFNPEAKAIAVLRNPVSRAWSQYLMNLREAKTRSPHFVDEVFSDAESAVTGWGANHQYLELGKYAEQLKRFIDLFGRDRVKAVFFEEYKAAPQKTMAELCSFLEIDPDFAFDFSTESNKASLPRNAALNSLLVKSGAVKFAKGMTPKRLRSKLAGVLYSDKNIPEIRPEDRKVLRDFYADEVAALSRLLKTDKPYTLWKDFK